MLFDGDAVIELIKYKKLGSKVDFKASNHVFVNKTIRKKGKTIVKIQKTRQNPKTLQKRATTLQIKPKRTNYDTK